MSKWCKKWPTSNASFQPGKHGFMIKHFRRNIVNIYVRTFVIYQLFYVYMEDTAGITFSLFIQQYHDENYQYLY